MDPDALADAKPMVRAAVHAYYAATTSSSPGGRPSFVAVCPQNGPELVAARAALAWADGDEVIPGGGGGGGDGAVVLVNPKFPLAPRELASFQCAFGLAPFKVQVLGCRRALSAL